MSEMEFLFSFIVTWIIILSPPAIIRFAAIRKPIKSKGIVIAICLVLFFVNHIIFVGLLGSQSKSHLAITLGAFVSYWLLRYETSKQTKNRIAEQRRMMGYD